MRYQYFSRVYDPIPWPTQYQRGADNTYFLQFGVLEKLCWSVNYSNLFLKSRNTGTEWIDFTRVFMSENLDEDICILAVLPGVNPSCNHEAASANLVLHQWQSGLLIRLSLLMPGKPLDRATHDWFSVADGDDFLWLVWIGSTSLHWDRCTVVLRFNPCQGLHQSTHTNSNQQHSERKGLRIKFD